MNNVDKNLDTDDFEPRVYEVGYHVIPTVAEGDIPSVIDSIRGAIESLDGNIISEDSPKLMDLAYSMDHIAANKKTVFDSAYFGWIKFECNPGNIIKIKDFFDKKEDILRFIIIKTVKEDTLSKKTNKKTKQATSIKDVKNAAADTKDASADKKEAVSDEEVDKAIEELVA